MSIWNKLWVLISNQRGELDTTPMVSSEQVADVIAGNDPKEPSVDAPTVDNQPPASGTTTPPAPAPGAAVPAPGPAAAAPEPEIALPDGRKVKLSDLKAWEEAHGIKVKLDEDSTKIKYLMSLDEHLTKNPQYADLMLGLLKTKDPAKLEQFKQLLAGSQPAAQPSGSGSPTAPGAQPAFGDLIAQIKDKLDLEDPSVKALYDVAGALHKQVSDLSSRFGKVDERLNAEDEARQVAEEQKKWQARLDTAWKTQKFDELLSRVSEDKRAGAANEIRKRILYNVVNGDGRVSLEEVAKTIRDDVQGMFDGLISGYNAKKDGANPVHGGKSAAPVGKVEQPPTLGEETRKAMEDGLAHLQASRSE
jgi:hypothetical protein